MQARTWEVVDCLWVELINIPVDVGPAASPVITEPQWQAEEARSPPKIVLPPGIV